MDSTQPDYAEGLSVVNFSDENDLQASAGEYVLGSLSIGERKIVDAELKRNRALATAVGQWQDRLLRLAPATEAVEPAIALWQRIEGNLPAGEARKTIIGRGWCGSVQFWRVWGLAGAMAVMVLALMLVMAPSMVVAPVRFLAVLETPGGGARWVVQADATSVPLIPIASVAPGVKQSLQFWTKEQGAVGPTSLGLIAANQRIMIPTSRLPGLSANQLFEVTLEPESGSPLSRPTGPVLALGRTVRL